MDNSKQTKQPDFVRVIDDLELQVLAHKTRCVIDNEFAILIDATDLQMNCQRHAEGDISTDEILRIIDAEIPKSRKRITAAGEAILAEHLSFRLPSWQRQSLCP